MTRLMPGFGCCLLCLWLQSVGAATRTTGDTADSIRLAGVISEQSRGQPSATSVATTSTLAARLPVSIDKTVSDTTVSWRPWNRLRGAFLEASRKLSSGLGRIAPRKLIAFIGLSWRGQIDETATEAVDVGFFLDDEPCTALAPFDGQHHWTDPLQSRRQADRISRSADDALTRLERVRSEWDYRDGYDQLELFPTISFGAVYRF